MKKESLDEVKFLIKYVEKNESKFDNETLCAFRKSLNMIMFMEVNSPKIGKFDIFKFTANDELRPILSCVHYEDGMCSATDGKMIVRTKIGYKEAFDGKNISRTGREFDERYPNVNSVIPNITESHTEYEVDFDLIDAYVKSGKIWAQTNLLQKSKIENHLVINFHGAYLRLMKLQVLCTAMKAIGMNSLYVNKDNLKAVFMKNDDNEVVIIMPLMPDEKYKDVNEYFYCEILNGMEKRFYELVKGEFCYAIGTNKEKLLSLAKERQMNVVEITEREYDWRSINLRVEQIYE